MRASSCKVLSAQSRNARRSDGWSPCTWIVVIDGERNSVLGTIHAQRLPDSLKPRDAIRTGVRNASVEHAIWTYERKIARNPLGTLPPKAARMHRHVEQSQRARGLSPGRAAASAWAVVKRYYVKRGKRWVLREHDDRRERRSSARRNLRAPQHLERAQKYLRDIKKHLTLLDQAIDKDRPRSLQHEILRELTTELGSAAAHVHSMTVQDGATMTDRQIMGERLGKMITEVELAWHEHEHGAVRNRRSRR